MEKIVIGYDEVTFGTETLFLKSISKVKTAGTLKQKIGGTLVKHAIPDRTQRDWSITGNGVIFETSTTATAARTALEGLNDLEPYTYNDGMKNTTNILMVMENLTFNDDESNPLQYTYSVKFIQFQQAD